MSKSLQNFIYILISAIGFLAFYTLLNAGSPESFLRALFPDPRSDIYIALISSVLVFILGFVVFYSRDREGFRHLLELNQDKIRKMRHKNMTDQEIAESILGAMGSRTGYRHNLARKKLLLYLSEFE
ncbi:MAG: hypothetical protein K9K64_15000 [Desulfohalobiaceae bacterium]|nr:hypothetical protein [Desulfohalobiaceae bacterium]